MNKPASKQVEVQIMGQSYLLACPIGGESALLDAVERVDTAMCRIRDAGKVKARDRIAVLASLNLAFELSQKESQSYQASSFDHTEPGPDTAEASAAEPPDPAAQARMDELIRRLDHTLGRDGQLI
ncbi:MAG: cell division protein ZapA [Burkholderiales bacterium RIFCSPLOWO2_12_67_14]|nr:MAG: cell division protein ZapA [Burkholderiales bacterium RIFCSPLOWO2_02_FULL_67_64]OGB42802.1 MAG: cell division protein ZapA [Burkholderiales bacterium RIFCSPLOWO2_12_67_14]OGB52993.1 MAG: cell division protein ZapA [Burkholderiales bacterium RIFCSPHIGHO2_12_FULL_67_38]